MRTIVLLLVINIFLNGCSHFGGGQSVDHPLQVKNKLNNEDLSVIDNAFDIGSPIVDHHLHIIGEEEISTVMKNICPDYAADALAANGGKDINARAWINEERFNILGNPLLWLKTKVLMSALKVSDRKYSDIDSVKRLLELVEWMVVKSPRMKGYDVRIHLLAIDGYYKKGGYTYDPKFTDMYIPNDYVIHLSRCLNEKIPDKNPFVPVISINPYKAKAIEELEKYKNSARYIKWLAPAMGFDPLDPYNDAFLEKVKEYGMVIMSHTGGEHAFDVKDESFRKYGDPLRLVRALDLGIPVILSHAGGDDDDGGTRNKDNFFRMMKDDRNDKKWCLFGDTSALTLKKNIAHFDELLKNDGDLYKYKMLYGSDYPLPVTWFLNSLYEIMYYEYISEDLVVNGEVIEDSNAVLLKLFKHNPLAYDVVIKRNLRPRGNPHGKTLPKEMFMSLEENIRREHVDTSSQLKKREQCWRWYSENVVNQ